jgi:hypothetical protein
MKKTAVEWLQERISIGLTYEQEVLFEGLFHQAKEMEKEQMIDAYWASYKEGQYSGDKTADEYYNQTFKSEQ